jgi:hypothetical protein
VQLDDVASRIRHEGLELTVDLERVADLDSLGSQLGDDRGEADNAQSEVLAEIHRRWRLEEMDLVRPDVDPGSWHAEVWAILSYHSPEHLGVERHCEVHLRHVHGDMMDSEWLHACILSDHRRSTTEDMQASLDVSIITMRIASV